MMEWIKVEDRLPEEDVSDLICWVETPVGGEWWHMAFYCDESRFVRAGWQPTYNYKVTHWYIPIEPNS